MKKNVRVSVILPVFNSDKYVSQAIQSVLQQTCEDLELIIIDDGSSDNTVKIVSQFDDSRIILMKQKFNGGPSTARNMGLKVAKGEWVAFIDADDYWHNERLIRLLEVAKQYSNVFIGSDIMICFSGQQNELIPWKTKCKDRGIKVKIITFSSPYDFVKNGFDVKPICPLGIIRQFGLKFNEEVRGGEWLEFILNLFQAGLYLVVFNEPLYYYRITPHSLSTTYRGVLSDLKSFVHLQSVDWLDEKTREDLRKKSIKAKYRLLTTALRERRWQEALHHAFHSPGSVWYLLHRFPEYMIERHLAPRLSKK